MTSFLEICIREMHGQTEIQSFWNNIVHQIRWLNYYQWQWWVVTVDRPWGGCVQTGVEAASARTYSKFTPTCKRVRTLVSWNLFCHPWSGNQRASSPMTSVPFAYARYADSYRQNTTRITIIIPLPPILRRYTYHREAPLPSIRVYRTRSSSLGTPLTGPTTV